MSGNVVVDRSKEVAFPRSYQPSQGVAVDTDGNEDLYSKLKGLEKQLEFLEIQVGLYSIITAGSVHSINLCVYSSIPVILICDVGGIY